MKEKTENNNLDKANNAGKNPELDKDNADIDNTDKYLAMEQPGVQYTKDSDPAKLSDNKSYSNGNDKWNPEGGNSKNSEAFNQDEYILDDNIDLDEDQNQSISTEDDDFEETNERY